MVKIKICYHQQIVNVYQEGTPLCVNVIGDGVGYDEDSKVHRWPYGLSPEISEPSSVLVT